MSRYLFFSHDGYGLGHARRNTVIARAGARRRSRRPDRAGDRRGRDGSRWLEDDGRIARRARPATPQGFRPAPTATARCRSTTRSPSAAGRCAEEVTADPPDVVVVDRHPFGTAGELRPGLELARAAGAALVLGLRDVLDEPTVVAEELRRARLAGRRRPVRPRPRLRRAAARRPRGRVRAAAVTPEYCGWVVARPPSAEPEPRLLAVAAGGGGDGGPVFRLGSTAGRAAVDVAGRHRGRAVRRAGGGAATGRRTWPRLRVLDGVASCSAACSPAPRRCCAWPATTRRSRRWPAARRPILVPRRSPRREQAIRAWRLAALGLADVVDEGADAEEVNWLLDRDRSVTPTQLTRPGICAGRRRTCRPRLGWPRRDP